MLKTGIFLALLCVLAAASVANESIAKTRLRIPALPNLADIDPISVARQRAVNRFLELNPDVELQSAKGIRIDAMNADVTTIMMIAGDIAPDVIEMRFRSIDTFVRLGMVAPLEENIAIARSEGSDPEARILPAMNDVVHRPGPDGKRRLYALPDQWTVRGLYYNRELFRQAGLPERAPRDWEEMAVFARRISELGPEYKGLLLGSGASASWDLMNFIWSAGGDAVKEMAPDEWRAAFNTQEAASAYRFYYQLVEIDRTVVRMGTGNIAPEQRERIGMFFGHIGDTTEWNTELFAFGAVPKGPTGIRGSEINSTLLGIYSQIKDPKVRDAAWRYVLFMTGPEAEKIRVDTMVELGQGAQVNPVALRRHGHEDFLSLSPPGLEREIEETISNGKPEPYGKNCNLIYQEMTYPLDRILLSKAVRKAWLAGDKGTVNSEIQAILNAAVSQTNERMIGYVSPETMKQRRHVAVAAVAAIFCLFVSLGWYVARIFSRSAALIARPVNSRSFLPWFCLFPALGLIFAWHYLPLFRGTIMAFQDYQLILKTSFVGLDNFANALFDPTFWRTILATLHFATYTLTFGFLTPVLLAYALHLIPKYKILYRTIYYLPAVMSVASIFFLWRELFGVNGPLNEALRFFGFEARRAWTEEPALAMLTCILPGIWAGAGPGCLIYLAALKTIPEEQFEAAEIDGAGFLHKTTKIVIPSLSSLIFINFIGAVAAAFHGATNILIMTGGGPNGLTEVASLKIFFEAFTRMRFGPAAAMAWIIGSMLVGLTVIQLKRLSQMEFKTAK